MGADRLWFNELVLVVKERGEPESRMTYCRPIHGGASRLERVSRETLRINPTDYKYGKTD